MNKTYIVLFFTIFIVACSSPKNPETYSKNKNLRIVSLAQSVTKELQQLGLDSNIVGATSYCSITQNRKELIIGNATDVNTEKILLLKPDIVLATALTKPETIEILRKSGITVHLFEKMDSYEEICSHFIELGKLVGKENLAKKIVNQSKMHIDSLKNLVPAKHEKQKIFFQIGAKPIFAVIPNTYMNDFITFAGCENIATDMTRGVISRESVLLRNPDIIFITTMGITGNDEKKIWESYPNLSAAKKKRIYIIDSDKACTPTLLSFEETFAEIINLIY